MNRVSIVKRGMAAMVTAAVLFGMYLLIVRVMLADQLEAALAFEIDSGRQYCFQLGNFKNAKKCFGTAVFLDKYIVFWNDNTRLPECYENLGYVLWGMENYDKAAEMYEKSLSAYEKYLPQSYDNIAYTHTRASLIYALCDDNDMVMQHAGAAYSYYRTLPAQRQNINVGTAAMGLACAYCNNRDYEKAVEYFEIAVPILYKNMDWSIENDDGPKVLAVVYKMAAAAYQAIGDEEKCQSYEEKYRDMIWIRSIGEDDIDKMMELMHWKIY